MNIGSKISLLRNLFVGLTIIMLLVSSSKAIADQVVVVKVIENRQEKRKSTRWTLTEWLKIKERMKMMDVWLAMFSPKKPEFTPRVKFEL